VPGATGNRLGPDWAAAWVERGRSVALVQRCIDELERDERVDATIYCCAEGYPAGSFRAARPLVLPYRVTLSYAQALAESRGGAGVVGLLTHGTRQRKQQEETIRAQPWASRVTFRFETLADEPLGAAERMAGHRPDFVIYWGYGVDLAPGDPPDLIARIEEAIGRPVVVPHVLSTLFVRNLLRPGLRGRPFVAGGS
jgi:hypothetical protein